MQYLIFDVVIAAVILLFFGLGYNKGFILTFCGLIAIFVAFFGASVATNVLAEPAANALEPVIARSVHDALTLSVQHSAENQSAEELLTDIPLDVAMDALKGFPFWGSFVDAFQHAVDSGVADVTARAARSLAHYAAVQIARTVIFLCSFVVLIIAWFFISHGLDLVAKLPVLSTVNHWSGAAIGFIKGFLLALIAVWLLKDSFIPQDAIRHTFLLRFLCTVDPIAVLLHSTHISAP